MSSIHDNKARALVLVENSIRSVHQSERVQLVFWGHVSTSAVSMLYTPLHIQHCAPWLLTSLCAPFDCTMGIQRSDSRANHRASYIVGGMSRQAQRQVGHFSFSPLPLLLVPTSSLYSLLGHLFVTPSFLLAPRTATTATRVTFFLEQLLRHFTDTWCLSLPPIQ